MVTQFHTLLHFVTLNHTHLSPTACVAASIRIQGVSKSHLLSETQHFPLRTHIYTNLYSGAYTRTTSGIDLVSIHICGNHSRTIFLLRVMITTRLQYSTVKRSPSRSQSLRTVYSVIIVIAVTSLFMAISAQ